MRKPRFPFACSGTHLMLWVANKFAQLPSLLVQLIDDSILPFFLCKKGFGVYLLVFVPRAS
jgi:hypothetical protein